ncbi:MAG: hypothetical protein QG658_16 [Patescibacteria group bacterium]|jgi:hypothetical protein|nr:hypothetical protein [Patescibacteria group bacterium]
MNTEDPKIFIGCSALAIRARDVICHDGANHVVEQTRPGSLRARHTVDITMRQITEDANQGQVQTITFGHGQQLRRQVSRVDAELRARRSSAFIDTTGTEVM